MIERTATSRNNGNGRNGVSKCPYCKNPIELGQEVRHKHRKDKRIVRCPHDGCGEQIVLVIANKNERGEKYIKEILEPKHN